MTDPAAEAIATDVRRFRLRPDVGLLFDTHQGYEHRLNSTAIEVVTMWLCGVAETEIAQTLAERYTVEPSRVALDVKNLLDRIQAPVDLKRGVEFEKQLNARPEFPFALELELTRACDWRCVFCYNVWKISPERRPTGRDWFLPFATIERVLREGHAAGLLRVRYSGGEPTLHPDFQTILNLGAELGLYQVLFTNGRSITANEALLWKSLAVREVLVSIHGDSTEHDALVGRKGSHDKTRQRLGYLIEAGLRVVVEMVATKGNLHVLEAEMTSISEELPITEFRLMRYVPTGRPNDESLALNQEQVAELVSMCSRVNQRGLSARMPCSPRYCGSERPHALDLNTLTDMRSALFQHCNAGVTWGSVAYDGKMRVCPHSDTYFGDAETDSVVDVWNGPMADAVNVALRARSEGCGGCAALADCRGGCHLPFLTKT